MLYEIIRRYSLHEGGTKYYQTIVIRKRDKAGKFYRGYLINDWGSATRDTFPRIGKAKSYLGDASGATSVVRSEAKKRLEKSRRGYTSWKEEIETLNSDIAFMGWITELCSDPAVCADAIAVFECVDGTKEELGMTDEVAEPAPTIEVENDSINSDNPAWGCW